MPTSVQTVVQECTAGSDSGLLTFPQVVMKLMEVGVERYYADLSRSEKIYYMPNGEVYTVASDAVTGTPARDFSAPDVAAAIKAVQGQTINYHEFCERIVAAGCVGYFVSLVGRRAVYFGRTSESHVELFPSK